MWFDYGPQKNKHSWSWRSWLSIMYQSLANGGTCQNVFWHHHTLQKFHNDTILAAAFP